MTRRMILATLSAALAAPLAGAQETTTTTPAPAQDATATPGRAASPARNATAPGRAVVQDRDVDTPAVDATNGRQPAATGRKAPVDDTLFLAAVADGGIAEVTLSELGLQRATDPQLKQFSQRMIDDHTRANQQLRALAAQRNVKLPTVVDPRAQFCAQSLAGLSGEEFDGCYAKAQFLMHMDAVAMFEAEAERGRDPQIKALAAKLLPTIQEHLAMIKPLAMQAEQEKPSTGGAADHQPRRGEAPAPGADDAGAADDQPRPADDGGADAGKVRPSGVTGVQP